MPYRPYDVMDQDEYGAWQAQEFKRRTDAELFAEQARKAAAEAGFDVTGPMEPLVPPPEYPGYRPGGPPGPTHPLDRGLRALTEAAREAGQTGYERRPLSLPAPPLPQIDWGKVAEKATGTLEGLARRGLEAAARTGATYAQRGPAGLGAAGPAGLIGETALQTYVLPELQRPASGWGAVATEALKGGPEAVLQKSPLAPRWAPGYLPMVKPEIARKYWQAATAPTPEPTGERLKREFGTAEPWATVGGLGIELTEPTGLLMPAGGEPARALAGGALAAGIMGGLKRVGAEAAEEAAGAAPKVARALEGEAGRLGEAVSAGVPAKAAEVTNAERLGLRVTEPDKVYAAISDPTAATRMTFQEVKAKPVTVKGLEDWLLAVYKSDLPGNASAPWQVIDPVTGRSIGTGKTQAIAITDAELAIERAGRPRFDASVSQAVAEPGAVSPRYSKVEAPPARPPAAEAAPVAQPEAPAPKQWSPAVQQALEDWRTNRAYINGNGNYHVKAEGRPSGPIASWNREAKQTFANVDELAQSAREAAPPTPERPAYGGKPPAAPAAPGVESAVGGEVRGQPAGGPGVERAAPGHPGVLPGEQPALRPGEPAVPATVGLERERPAAVAFRGAESFPEPARQAVSDALAQTPEEVRTYVAEQGPAFAYHTPETLKTLAPEDQEGLRGAAMGTLRNGTMVVVEGKKVTPKLASHELVHTVGGKLPLQAYADAERTALEDGEALVRLARNPEGLTGDVADAASLARDELGSIRIAPDRGMSLTYGLSRRESAWQDLAQHLGIPRTDSQWLTMAVHNYLAKDGNYTLRFPHLDEERVAYLAGADPEYAKRLFSEVNRRAGRKAGAEVAERAAEAAPAERAAPTLAEVTARQKAGEITSTEARRLQKYVETGNAPEGYAYNPETRKVEIVQGAKARPSLPPAEREAAAEAALRLLRGEPPPRPAPPVSEAVAPARLPSHALGDWEIRSAQGRLTPDELNVWSRQRGAVGRILTDRPTQPDLLADRGASEAVLAAHGRGDLFEAEENIKAARLFWPSYGGPERAPEFRASIERAEAILTTAKATLGREALEAAPLPAPGRVPAPPTPEPPAAVAAPPSAPALAVPPHVAARRRGPRVTKPVEMVEQPPEAAPPAEKPPTPPKPPEQPPTPPVPPAAQVPPEPPAPGQRLARILPTAQIEQAISEKAKTLISKLGDVPVLGRVARAVDPWLVATEHVERIPLVWRSMEDTGRNITRQAMQNLEDAWRKVEGVKIEKGYFAEGVKVRPGYEKASLAWGDVVENPHRYDMPDPLRKFIREANALNDELVDWAKQEGVKVREMKFEPGGHYFGRVVREVRGAEKRLRMNPGMERHYDSMEAGIAAGVKYEDDLLATAQAGYDWLVRKVVSKRMHDALAPLGRTPRELLDTAISERAMAAAKKLQNTSRYERLVKQIRDGLSPYQTQVIGGQPRKVLRAPLKTIGADVPGLQAKINAALKLKGPDRRQAFVDLLDEARDLRARAAKDFQAAKSARAKAMEGLRSAEWAEGPKFGLPEGTIGLGRVEAPFAQGRLFPRETADYLSREFDRKTNKMLSTVNSVSAASRLLTTGFDLGTMMIQLLPALSHPKAWGKAAGYMLRSLADPGTYKAYVARPENQEAIRKLVPYGLTLEGAEYGEALTTGLRLQRLMPRGVAERVALVFEGPLNVAKIEMAKGLIPTAEKAGQMRELAGFLNNMTGTQSLLAQGLGPNQRLAEGALVFFSPRYTRSGLALIAQALGGGIGGAEARKALGAVMAAGIALPYAVNLAQGQEPHEGFFDPTSPWFLSAQAFGRRVGVGGIYRSLATLAASSLRDAQQDPQAFLSPDRLKNPVLRWASGRSAPATSLLWDAATGHDFLGEPLTTPREIARRGLGMVLPMWAQEPVEQAVLPREGEKPPTLEEGVGGAGLELAGLRTVPLTTAQKRDALIEQIAREKGKAWADLDTVDRWELQQKHPELAELVKQGQAERARRGDVVSVFWQAVQTAREPRFEEVKALTADLKAGKMSGQDYRDAIGDLEARMARMPEELKKAPEFKEVPLTREEKAAYYKGRPEPEQSPTDKYLEQYYGLAEQFTDKRTGIVDIPRLMETREELKAKTDPAVVERATRYVGRNRDPEYQQALETYREYQAIPAFIGLSRDDADQANEAAKVVALISRRLPPGTKDKTDYAKTVALRERPDLRKWIVRLDELNKRRNPRRQLFWSRHAAELEKFFGGAAVGQKAA